MTIRLPRIALPLLAGLVLAALAACASDATASNDDFSTAALNGGSGPSSSTGGARMKCERRSNRSKVSVDGRGLAAGSYTARIRSGSSQASAPAQSPVRGEVEFDFDSDGGDIAAGATAIAADFIVVNAAGADVTGEILDASGAVVRTQSVDCRVR